MGETMSTTHNLAGIDELPTQCKDVSESAVTTVSSKFHLSLNVHDLPKTAAFLEVLLGVKPTQLHGDYAKFELADPPLVLSLAPTDVPTSSGLNHLGFRLPNREALEALQQRLSDADVLFDVEESVACCHSRQTKFWVHDPAGNLWEFYVLEEPGACDSTPSVAAAKSGNISTNEPILARWAHRLGEPLPEHIHAENGSLDEVVLEGTFNAQPANGQPGLILGEAARTLRAGGLLLMHGVTADRPLSHSPALPGPAAAVKYVPTTRELLDAVKAAGFVNLELTTFGETYRFTHAGAELRETRIRAWRAETKQAPLDQVVIYRGPFAEVRDDSGRVFRRGEPTCVDERTSERLAAINLRGKLCFRGRAHRAEDRSGDEQK